MVVLTLTALVSIQDAASDFGFRIVKGGWKYGEKTLIFHPQDSSYTVGGRKFRMYRFRIREKRLYIHPDEAASAAYWLSGKGWFYDSDKRRFFSRRPTVKKLLVREFADSVVVIVFGRGFRPALLRNDTSRISIQLKGAFYPKYSYIRGDGKILRAVAISHTFDGMVLGLIRGKDFGFFHIQETRDGLRVVLFRGLSGGVVVLDPGHGGRDPGAVANGYREKDITLSVARKVRRILEKEYGLRVVMTRQGDRFISLAGRSEIARKNRTLIFVSIHCNYSRNRRARGPETYFLSTARTSHERAVELLENSVIKYEMEGSRDDIEYIVSDMLQNAFMKESQKLALSVHRHLAKGRSDRGVRQAGFYVLRKIYAPSILVELGYLSNKEEARLLADETYQWELARRIARGISEYLQEYVRR